MPTSSSLWMCKERGFTTMVTDHRSHRDAVESPHLGIFTKSQDTALGNRLQVTQLHLGDFPFQTICFCKNKELQCPMNRPDKRCCYALFWGVTGGHRAAEQLLSHAANGTCSTPKQAGVRGLRGTACTPAGSEIPHLEFPHKGKFLIWTLAEAAERRPRKARRWF